MKLNYPSLVLLLVLLCVTMRSIAAFLDWWNYVDPQVKLELMIEERGYTNRRIPTCNKGEFIYFNKLQSGELIYWCGK